MAEDDDGPGAPSSEPGAWFALRVALHVMGLQGADRTSLSIRHQHTPLLPSFASPPHRDTPPPRVSLGVVLTDPRTGQRTNYKSTYNRDRLFGRKQNGEEEQDFLILVLQPPGKNRPASVWAAGKHREPEAPC